jgi:hypothetical protein
VQAEQADPQLVRESKLSSCRISNEPLQQPVVCDFLGNIFSKAAVLEFLLARKHGAFADAEVKTR